MKFRLPNVPPGARLRLKYSLVTPYACASETAAPSTAAAAHAATIVPPRPPSAATREAQNTAAHERVIARARSASQWFVAKSALTPLSAT